MNTKAIYTVHENGKEHYFFSEHAGGFSYPFAVADFLHSLKGVLNGSDVTTKRIMCSTNAGTDERQLFVPGRDRRKGIIYCG